MFKKLDKINKLIAVTAITYVGTMACFYLFFVWSILPLVLPKYQTFISYVSSSVIQLILLPLIMVGQNYLNKKTETRAAKDHSVILSEFEKIKNISDKLDKLEAKLDK